MRKAGYDAAEAAKVWENLQLEIKARPDGDASGSPFFATHPPAAERQQALAELARASPGGVANEARWREGVKPFLRDWLHEEVKRGQHEESLEWHVLQYPLHAGVQRWVRDLNLLYRATPALYELDFSRLHRSGTYRVTVTAPACAGKFDAPVVSLSDGNPPGGQLAGEIWYQPTARS